MLRGGLLVAGHVQHPIHGAGGHAAQCLPGSADWCARGDPALRREAGGQADQESRSAGGRAAASLTAMAITIHYTFLPHSDPDESLAFYRDVLGFEVRNDVGYGGQRWITIGLAGQPSMSIVLEPPAADPGITDDERRTIV